LYGLTEEEVAVVGDGVVLPASETGSLGL